MSGRAQTNFADGIGNEDGKPVPVYQFDFSALEGDLGELADHAGISLEAAALAREWQLSQDKLDHLKIAAGFLSRVLSQIIPRPPKIINADTVGTKIVALFWLLGGQGEALVSIAKRIRKSKQLLSIHARTMENLLQFHGCQQKRISARESYAKSAANHWAKLSPEERSRRRRGEWTKSKTASSRPEAVSD
jgi:hypothetical protein